MTPETLLAYAPRGPGVMCAMFYFVLGDDVYGWWIGAQDGDYPPAYFMLENFYADADTRFFATAGNDLYGGWTREYTEEAALLPDPVPIDQDVCHRIEQTQAQFAQEWLFFADDAGTAPERAAYEADSLPVMPVNIKHQRLHRLEVHAAVWTRTSPNADLHVIEYLRERWPLDYRLE
jgi:hypothetical protein